MEIIQIKGIRQNSLERKRVAAYARVSVSKEAGIKSLSAQVSYYNELIGNNPHYEYVGVYTDEGLSGTKPGRPGFQQMMEDAREHKFDLLITKSITRFARNTMTLLQGIRELKGLGIDVYFEKEDMHSISPDGELMLTLLAMYAEEEARSTSENICWATQKRFERGEYSCHPMYGYAVKDGNYRLLPEEAKIIRRIYREYLEGATIYGITKALNAEEIPTKRGGKWNHTGVITILTNIKYTGSMLLQRYYKKDFWAGAVARNKGERRQVFVMDTHEPIISREIYDQVQAEMERRAEERPKYPRNNPDNLFRTLVVCKECGYRYKRVHNKAMTEKKPYYTCRAYKDFRGKCKNHQIPERVLMDKTREILDLDSDIIITRELLLKRIDHIEARADFSLTYYLKDKNGRAKKDGVEFIKTIYWQDAYGWTKERRKTQSERTTKQWKNVHNQQNGENNGK